VALAWIVTMVIMLITVAIILVNNFGFVNNNPATLSAVIIAIPVVAVLNIFTIANDGLVTLSSV
jgi:hypothetical protein